MLSPKCGAAPAMAWAAWRVVGRSRALRMSCSTGGRRRCRADGGGRVADVLRQGLRRRAADVLVDRERIEAGVDLVHQQADVVALLAAANSTERPMVSAPLETTSPVSGS
jgi:hypothetical protein